MHPISELLDQLQPYFHSSPSLDIGGEWAIQFPAQEIAKFEVLVKGHCWIQVEGAPTVHSLHQGDCFLLNADRPFMIGNSLQCKPLQAETVFEKSCGCLLQFQGGGACLAAGGRFTFEGNSARSFFAALPAIVVLPAASEEAKMVGWALQALPREIEAEMSGDLSSVQQLARTILLQVLRYHLGTTESIPLGIFAAMGDQHLARAVSHLHGDLARAWTIESLAKTAAMSRSAFAERFRRVMRSTPAEYLVEARMRRASQLLRTTKQSSLQIAQNIGYQSASAFSTAFRRQYGISPRKYRARKT